MPNAPKPSKRPSTKDAHVRVWQKSGSGIVLPASDYGPLRQAILDDATGCGWYSTTGLYGSSVLIRLDSITDVHLLTVRAMENARADSDVDESEAWRGEQ